MLGNRYFRNLRKATSVVPDHAVVHLPPHSRPIEAKFSTCLEEFVKLNEGNVLPSHFKLMDYRSLEHTPETILELFQQLYKVVAALESQEAKDVLKSSFHTNTLVLHSDVYFAAILLHKYVTDFNVKAIEHNIDISFDPYYEKFKHILKVLTPKYCVSFHERKEKLIKMLPHYFEFTPSFFINFKTFFNEMKNILQKAPKFRSLQAQIVKDFLEGDDKKSGSQKFKASVAQLRRFFFTTFKPIRYYDTKTYLFFGSLQSSLFIHQVIMGIKSAYSAQILPLANTNDNLSFISLICYTDYWYYYIFVSLLKVDEVVISRGKDYETIVKNKIK
ncbi:hypothetical protein HMI54_006065 [Coelomomyces lativittatus]|nr:hypothetical protein HMI54_006065 [Coelomomyces lativittatus]